MTIEELRRKREKLAKEIRALIYAFEIEIEAFAVVDAIEVERFEDRGVGYEQASLLGEVRVEIKLNE